MNRPSPTALLTAFFAAHLGACFGASPAAAQLPTAELHFARMQYQTVNYCPNLVGAFREAWTTDWDEAEYNLTEIIRRLTRVTGRSPDGAMSVT